MLFSTFHLFSCPPWSNPYDTIEHEYEQVLHAEKLGMHEVWLGEHNARTYGIAGSSVLSAGVIAGMTERIRIGTAVTRVPLHHPLRLAEDLAHVDIVSNGRLDWGVGKGYDSMEFGTYGVPFEEREERWEENFNAVRNFWLSGRTHLDGKFTQCEDAEFFPTLLQRPTLPIYVMVSKSDSSVIWAAERLFPIVLGSRPDMVDAKHKMELFEKTALEAGHSEEAVRHTLANVWAHRQVHVADSTERAEAEFERAMMWYFSTRHNRVMFGLPQEEGRSYRDFIDNGFVLRGSPDKVAEELDQYAQHTGIKNIACWFNVGGQPQPQVLNAMSRFAEDVVPMLSAH